MSAEAVMQMARELEEARAAAQVQATEIARLTRAFERQRSRADNFESTTKLRGDSCEQYARYIDVLRAQRDAALADVSQARAELESYRGLVEACKRLVERTAEIGESHPAYGFVVMGLPIAKALAGLVKP